MFVGSRVLMLLDVLIETYWNVNVFIASEAVFKKYVLIETYWNVNSGAVEL